VTGAINPYDAAGAKEMTRLAKAMLQRCPETKIVLGGYSQGAEQVHGALGKVNLGEDGAKILVGLYCIFEVLKQEMGVQLLVVQGCVPIILDLLSCDLRITRESTDSNQAAVTYGDPMQGAATKAIGGKCCRLGELKELTLS
jgi:hypothetical protein